MPRFLVVDDDPSTVKGVSLLLACDGHEVAPFTAGAHAVEALSRESFDAIVTDLEMPDIDGHAVVRASRQHNPQACVVVVTAKAEEKCQSLVDAGACIVTDKPFEYAEVTKAVGDCRSRGGPGAHGRCHMRSRPHEDQSVPLRRK
jgi:CheY-like chemotaxis protein